MVERSNLLNVVMELLYLCLGEPGERDHLEDSLNVESLMLDDSYFACLTLTKDPTDYVSSLNHSLVYLVQICASFGFTFLAKSTILSVAWPDGCGKSRLFIIQFARLMLLRSHLQVLFAHLQISKCEHLYFLILLFLHHIHLL